jgi:hypothetical protein
VAPGKIGTQLFGMRERPDDHNLIGQARSTGNRLNMIWQMF